jgi:predicted nucleic acid-binding protein
VIVIDTNVLVYAIDRDAADHEACRGIVERCRAPAEP